MPLYLADTSVWAWAKSLPALRERLWSRLADAKVVTAVPVVLEVLHSSRDGRDYEDDLTFLAPLTWLPLTQEVGMRAFEVQRALARTTHGAHRIPAVDYLVASVAEAAGPDVVVWHLDRDLGRLCEFVGQPHEHERLPRSRRRA